jgi:hypothetical protein
VLRTKKDRKTAECAFRIERHPKPNQRTVRRKRVDVASASLLREVGHNPAHELNEIVLWRCNEGGFCIPLPILCYLPKQPESGWLHR